MSGTILQQRYDGAAPRWAGMVGRLGYAAAYRGLLARVVPIEALGRICDIGTGAGDLALAFLSVAPRPATLTLVDLSPAMLAEAGRRLAPMPVTLVATSLEDFQDAQGFDLVMAAHLIEHCPDPGDALRQMARLARPGGRVLLIVSKPHWCQWLIWLQWRHRWFAPDTVLSLARAAGLVPVAMLTFDHGPPRRTSLGYLFHQPKGEQK